MAGKKCVVCSAPAEVFCHNDNAYLCAVCDVTVHQAHPVAASHHRVPICQHEKHDSPETQFEVPTVPDAFDDVKQPFEAKPAEVCPGRNTDEVIQLNQCSPG